MEGVFVRDVSSNGTRLRRDGELIRLVPGRLQPLRRGHEVVLHESVSLALSGRRHFRGEDPDALPPPPPDRSDATVLEGRHGHITGNSRKRGGRRR